jgi:hypothetical protein
VPDSGISKKTTQGQHRKEAEEDAAASFPLEGKNRKVLKEAWKEIEIEPCGSIQFCRMWEYFYENAAEGDLFSDMMERTIQECQGCGIRVPPPFFQAKRRIEKGQLINEPDQMALVKDLSDEVARFAGPRGIPDELMR